MIKKSNLYTVFGLVLSFIGLFSALTLPLGTTYEHVSFDSHGHVTERVNLIGVAINVVGVCILLYGLSMLYFQTNKGKQKSAKRLAARHLQQLIE
jgi:hypothetical protein